MADPTATTTTPITEKYAPYHDRVPSKPRTNGVPIEELVANGEPVQHIRKKIVYEYRPLYTIAFVICFGMLVWATAYTIEQLSDNATAQACVNVGGAWMLSDNGNQSECQRTLPVREEPPTNSGNDGATLEPEPTP